MANIAQSEYYNLEARRDARESVKHPGKFEGESPMTVILYNIAMDGASDSFWTDGDGEWAESIGRWIVSGDNHGFIYSQKEDSAEHAYAIIEALNAEEETDE